MQWIDCLGDWAEPLDVRWEWVGGRWPEASGGYGTAAVGCGVLVVQVDMRDRVIGGITCAQCDGRACLYGFL